MKWKNSSAHTRFWQTSEFIFIICLAGSLAIDLFIPLEIPFNSLYLGAIIVILGISLLVTAKSQLKKHKQPTAPNRPTTRLVTSEVFKYSRNPVYLGLIFVYIGIGFMIKSLWILISTIVLIILIKKILIIPEENYLLKKFDKRYKDYKNKTGRWI